MRKINSSMTENLFGQTSVELTLIDIFFQHSIINTPLLLLIYFFTTEWHKHVPFR